MALEFVKSNKGVDFLVKDGYTFHKEKVINDKKKFGNAQNIGKPDVGRIATR